MDAWTLSREAQLRAEAMIGKPKTPKPKSKKARKQPKTPNRVYNCADGPIDPHHGLHPNKSIRPTHEVVGQVLCRVGTHKGVRAVLVYAKGTKRFSGDQKDAWGGA